MQAQPELTFVAPIVEEMTVDFDDELVECGWNMKLFRHEPKYESFHECAACGRDFQCTRVIVTDKCNCSYRVMKGNSTCPNESHLDCCVITFCSEPCFEKHDTDYVMHGRTNVRAWINSFCKN